MPRAAPAWVTRNTLFVLGPLWLLKVDTAPSTQKKTRWWWRCREPSFPFLAVLEYTVKHRLHILPSPLPFPAAHGADFASTAGPKSALYRLTYRQGVAQMPVSNCVMSDVRSIPSSSLTLMMNNNSKSLQRAQGRESLQWHFPVFLSSLQ